MNLKMVLLARPLGAVSAVWIVLMEMFINMLSFGIVVTAWLLSFLASQPGTEAIFTSQCANPRENRSVIIEVIFRIGSAGFGAMPEQQSVCKKLLPQVIARRERASK